MYAAGAGFATDITGKPGGSGFGNVVKIDHGMGISTVYAHLTQAQVPAEGAWVDETTQIGTVGSTGSSSTTHLHFERFGVSSAQATAADQVSVDPGPLFACRGNLLVSFPQVAGFDTWQGVAWGAFSVASDGPGCTTAPTGEDSPDPGAVAAEPLAPTADADADAAGAWADLATALRRVNAAQPPIG